MEDYIGKFIEKCVRTIKGEGDKMNDDEFVGKKYYGGKDNPYEAIKIIQAHSLDFELGCVVKYIIRAGHKDTEDAISDLMKARTYIDYEIEKIGKENEQS